MRLARLLQPRVKVGPHFMEAEVLHCLRGARQVVSGCEPSPLTDTPRATKRCVDRRARRSGCSVRDSFFRALAVAA